jgi:hypothetical protein
MTVMSDRFHNSRKMGKVVQDTLLHFSTLNAKKDRRSMNVTEVAEEVT